MWQRTQVVRGLVALLVGVVLVQALAQVGARAGAGAMLPAGIESRLRSELSTQAGVAAIDVRVSRIEAVTWRDGCLGVYRPEATCLLVVQDGYVVWGSAGGRGYRLHTDLSETIVLAADSIARASFAEAVLPDGVIATPDTRGRLLSGSIPVTGFGFIVFGGGTYADPVSATGCDVAEARFWGTVGGELLLFMPAAGNAPVNGPFDAAFAGSIARGTALIGTCPSSDVAPSGPPVLAASAGGNSGPLGLGSYCWRFEAGAPDRCDDAGLVTTAQVMGIGGGGEIAIEGLPAGLISAEAAVSRRPTTGIQEGANRISWATSGAPSIAVTAQTYGSRLVLRPDLEPGWYLLSLTLEWAAGDAVFGLKFDVH